MDLNKKNTLPHKTKTLYYSMLLGVITKLDGLQNSNYSEVLKERLHSNEVQHLWNAKLNIKIFIYTQYTKINKKKR